MADETTKDEIQIDEAEVKKLLTNIPNNVNNDGKMFVAKLKEYLKKLGLLTDQKISDNNDELTEKPTQVTNVALTEEHSVSDGSRVNTILVEWNKTSVENYAKAEVWYKVGDDGEWAKAGESVGTQYRYNGATTGSTYYIKVVSVNAKGNSADFDEAPQASITIKGNQYIPSPPTQFVLTWDEEGPLWEWLFVDNGYVDFFELRLDKNPGAWNDKRLDSTRETASRANPNVRSGTAYLYIRNIFGEYSEPAVHDFSKAMGSKPEAATLTATLDGVNIKLAGLPVGYTHYKLHITTTDSNETNDGYFTTDNSEYIYFFFSGTISVSYCFVDDIGKGEWSDAVTANVKDLIVNADNIAEGAVTTDKLAANAVTAAKISANAITADKLDAGAVTADKIEAGAITAEKLAADSVTSDAIQAGSVIGDKIAANSITTSKLASANIDLTGALTITGGNVKLSEEGLRLTNSDGSYTLFNQDGINYFEENGVAYAQVKKMIIGKAYDGQYIRFVAPWSTPPSVLTAPMTIQVNESSYSSTTLYLVCEATDISVNGFKINSYLRLEDGSYMLDNVERTDTTTVFNVTNMTQYWYGSYRYSYKFSATSDVMDIDLPNTANYVELSLSLKILNPFSYTGYDVDSSTSYTTNEYISVKYSGANSGATAYDNDTRTVTIQLYVGDTKLQETAYTVTDSSSSVTKNLTLSGRFDPGPTRAFVRICWDMNLTTMEHGPWSTLYNGRSTIASAACKCTLTKAYHKYSAATSKIARGYAMFLVTDGSTNTYIAETTVQVLINYNGSPLALKTVYVAGTAYTTDSSGYITMTGTSTKECVFAYSTAPTTTQTVTFSDGTITTVNISPADVTCYLLVTYDGTAVVNGTVSVNGADMTTDANGKIEIGGKDGSTGTYTVTYGIDSQTATVIYTDGGIITFALVGTQRLSLTVGASGRAYYGYSEGKHGTLSPNSLAYLGVTYTIKEAYTYSTDNFTTIIFSTAPPFSSIVAEIKGSRYIFNVLDDGNISHKNIFRVNDTGIFTANDDGSTYEITVHSIY